MYDYFRTMGRRSCRKRLTKRKHGGQHNTQLGDGDPTEDLTGATESSGVKPEEQKKRGKRRLTFPPKAKRYRKTM